MLQKAALLYFSSTKTTQKNLRAIAQGMGVEAEEFDFTLPQNRQKDLHFGKEDFVIIGSPVYGGVLPLLVREYLQQHVSGDGTGCAVVAVYGNRHYDDCLAEMEDLMSEKGFVVTAAAACIGEHSYSTQIATGRPDADDLVWAQEFGRRIKQKLQQPLKALGQGTIPGGRPYRERKESAPLAPETTNGCIRCGLCAKNCPTGAIDFADPTKVDGSKCLRCLACVRLCPLGSKAFTAEAFQNTVAWCLANFKEPRKEPEYYL